MVLYKLALYNSLIELDIKCYYCNHYCFYNGYNCDIRELLY